MADTKITALAAIATVDPAADVLPIVDISDTSMAASGTTKKVTSNQILGAGGTATLASATITGAATVGTTLGVTGVSTLASAVVTGALTVDTATLVVDPTNDRVGIGTTTPAYKLEVVAPAGNNIVSTFRSGDATAANNAGGGFQSISNATAASRVARVWLDADGADLSSGDYFFIQKNGNSGTVEFNQSSNAAMTFLTNATERARIDATGSLLVGATTLSANEILRANSINAAQWAVTMTSVDRGWLNRQSSAIGGIAAFFEVGSSSTNVGSITTTASATAYVTVSDYRLKENVQPLVGGLARISALKPSIYKWKVDGSDGEGFIAHELADIVPAAVTGKKDDVNADGTVKAQGVDLSKVVPILVAAIQELTAEVNALKNA